MGWALVIAAYLMGSVPTGVLVARVYGVDLRAAGSGNIGATNALRVIGRKAGVITLAGDVLKGTVPVLAASYFAGRGFGCLAAVAAIVGHDYSVFLEFKGGKGVATSLGALAALEPALAGIGVGVWVATALVFRYSSLAALVSFGVLPAAAYLMKGPDMALWTLTVFIAVMALVKHRSNIGRLIRGDEPKIGRNAEPDPRP